MDGSSYWGLWLSEKRGLHIMTVSSFLTCVFQATIHLPNLYVILMFFFIYPSTWSFVFFLHDNGSLMFFIFTLSIYLNFIQLIRNLSSGLCINPNLHMSSYVCLRLPGTTDNLDDKDEMWVPGSSTILQLLVNIQSRILNPKPLLNDVIYTMRIRFYREYDCYLYNENTLIKSLKTMVFIMNKPPNVIHILFLII